MLDQAVAPRNQEQLDKAVLEPFLRAELAPHFDLDRQAKLVVEQFPSGFSNLTYLLRWGTTELVLRRPPFGNRVASAHDMAREYRVLSALANQGAYPLAPKPFLYCEDESILGAPFYVMERRTGIVLRRHHHGTDLTPVLAARLSESFIDNLAVLHLLDYRKIGLADLGSADGYIERQVKGWSKRYQRAQTDSWPALDSAAAWLHDEIPSSRPGSLIHNDYKYDNLILAPDDLTRIVAVLDWEMCTVGDPRADLGTTLAYWTQANDDPRWRAAGFGPTAVAGSYTRHQLVERYRTATRFDLGDQREIVYFFVFGLFKLAVIVQQIYYRFFKGHTRDPRFAELNHLAGLLGEIADRAIETDSI